MPVARFIPPGEARAPEPTPDPDALTVAELVAATGMAEATAERLLPVAAEQVDRFAPDAPQATKNEAVIRVAGWLASQPAASIREKSVGPLSISFAVSEKSALRHSGAMGLLSPWKRRRAGALS